MAMWWYATGHPWLLIAPVDDRSRRLGLAIGMVHVAVYVVAIVVAGSLPLVSVVIYAAAPVSALVGTAMVWDSSLSALTEPDSTGTALTPDEPTRRGPS